MWIGNVSLPAAGKAFRALCPEIYEVFKGIYSLELQNITLGGCDVSIQDLCPLPIA